MILPDLASVSSWRQHLHRYPELAFQEHLTSDFVVAKLTELGVHSIHRGLAGTGVVASITGRRGPGPAIAIRADMDALPVQEANTFAHASRHSGCMHACGHDGHTAILLGTAAALAAEPDFAGTVHLIFQPAEEGGGGAMRMVAEGFFDLFPCDAVYALHNWPGLAAGHVGVRSGPIMASADRFDLVIQGRGGHAAMPHQTVDAVLIASQLVTAAQGLVSRQKDPLAPAVLSFTQIHAGEAYNVLPQDCTVRGTLRAFSQAERLRIMTALKTLAEGLCQGWGATCQLTWHAGYAPTINTPAEAAHVLAAARAILPATQIHPDITPSLAAEDFCGFLAERPGCYFFLGNGHALGGCLLHHPAYDFNDAIIGTGIRLWCELVRQRLGG